MHCSNRIVVERQVYRRSVQSRTSAINVRNMDKESNNNNASSELCWLNPGHAPYQMKELLKGSCMITSRSTQKSKSVIMCAILMRKPQIMLHY